MANQKPLVGAAIIGQSGGPSAVINATVYGAFHGIVGVLNDRLMIMDKEDPKEARRTSPRVTAALMSF